MRMQLEVWWISPQILKAAEYSRPIAIHILINPKEEKVKFFADNFIAYEDDKINININKMTKNR